MNSNSENQTSYADRISRASYEEVLKITVGIPINTQEIREAAYRHILAGSLSRIAQPDPLLRIKFEEIIGIVHRG